MTASIPAKTPEQKERVERLKTMRADRSRRLVYLASDASKDVTNQIFSGAKEPKSCCSANPARSG